MDRYFDCTYLFIRRALRDERRRGHQGGHHRGVDLVVAQPAHHLLDDLVRYLRVAACTNVECEYNRLRHCLGRRD